MDCINVDDHGSPSPPFQSAYLWQSVPVPKKNRMSPSPSPIYMPMRQYGCRDMIRPELSRSSRIISLPVCAKPSRISCDRARCPRMGWTGRAPAPNGFRWGLRSTRSTYDEMMMTGPGPSGEKRAKALARRDAVLNAGQNDGSRRGSAQTQSRRRPGSIQGGPRHRLLRHPVYRRDQRWPQREGLGQG
jgi:hypothetical protein